MSTPLATAGSIRRTPIVPEGRLVCGLQLPIQATSLRFVEAWERSGTTRDLEAVVRMADQSGFFYLAVCDHVAIPEAVAGEMGTTWYEPTTTLAWIAAMTQRVRVLTHLLVLPYRHPLLAAKTIMTLDALSSGRVILGVGPGDLPAEFELLGVDFARRGQLLDDALDVLRAAFATEFPEVDTGTWSLSGAGLAPRPVQQPVPIWLGGSSTEDIHRAAARGDGWLPERSGREEFSHQVALLRAHRASTVGDVPIDIGATAGPLYVGAPTWDVGAETLVGSPSQLAEALLGLAQAGANHLQVRLRSVPLQEHLDQVQAFGTEVIPLLDPDVQPSERYDEPPFREIAQGSRAQVQAMEASDDKAVWGAIGNEFLLLRTIGRRTGREHKVCVALWRDRQGRPILVGSYAGAPNHPDWYLNLLDRDVNPTVEVRTLGRRFRAEAEFLEGAEYDDVWARLTLDRPSYRNYSARTSRRFGLVRLLER